MKRTKQFLVVMGLLLLTQVALYVLLSVVPAMVSAPNTFAVLMAFPVGLTTGFVSANIWVVALAYLRKVEAQIKQDKIDAVTKQQKIINKNEGEVNAERN